MKRRRILVYGAGGHGKVVADILISRGKSEFAGFVDHREELWDARVIGLPVLDDGQWLRQEALNSRIAVALGVGESRSRQLLALVGKSRSSP
jgi:FlaA1/EpsC-like NDP-sugar epimerase